MGQSDQYGYARDRRYQRFWFFLDQFVYRIFVASNLTRQIHSANYQQEFARFYHANQRYQEGILYDQAV